MQGNALTGYYDRNSLASVNFTIKPNTEVCGM